MVLLCYKQNDNMYKHLPTTLQLTYHNNIIMMMFTAAGGQPVLLFVGL